MAWLEVGSIVFCLGGVAIISFLGTTSTPSVDPNVTTASPTASTTTAADDGDDGMALVAATAPSHTALLAALGGFVMDDFTTSAANTLLFSSTAAATNTPVGIALVVGFTMLQAGYLVVWGWRFASDNTRTPPVVRDDATDEEKAALAKAK